MSVQPENLYEPNDPRLAIIGMDLYIPMNVHLPEYIQSIYLGKKVTVNGSGDPEVLPPMEAQLSQVGKKALIDAGCWNDPKQLDRMGCVFWLRQNNIPVNPTSFIQTIVGDWMIHGPILDISEVGAPFSVAVQDIHRLISSKEVDSILWIAADLSDPYQKGDHSLPGIGAIVWMGANREADQKSVSYAVLESMCFQTIPSSAESIKYVEANSLQALKQAGITAYDVGYLEAYTSVDERMNELTLRGLSGAYGGEGFELTCAVNFVRANIDQSNGFQSLLALIRSATCLSKKMIPAVQLPEEADQTWINQPKPFYYPTEGRFWFCDREKPRRWAALSQAEADGTYSHCILSESLSRETPAVVNLSEWDIYPVPVSGNNLSDLCAKLEDLQQGLAQSDSLQEYVRKQMFEQEGNQKSYTVALMGHSSEEIRTEISYAIRALPQCFDRQSEWQTPMGSYFTPQPAGSLGEVALVYPGAFNSYVGLGKDLFFLFPSLDKFAAQNTADLGQVLGANLLYPRCNERLTSADIDQFEKTLMESAIKMLTSGTGFGVLYTYIIEKIMKIQARAAFGYSLGENSMLFANGVWNQWDEASARLSKSPAFTTRIAGPQNAVREYWQKATISDGKSDGSLWQNFVLMSVPEHVSECIRRYPKVFLTHINSPRQVVIGGDPEQCQRVVDELKCNVLQAPFNYALHCKAIASEFDELAELHRWPVINQVDIRLYSAADYRPLNLEEKWISQQIGRMLTRPLDFPRLIHQVYDDGARVFIELGAGSNCSRWIDETLRGKPHAALAINRKGSDDAVSMVRLMVRLCSHQVPFDYSWILPE